MIKKNNSTRKNAIFIIALLMATFHAAAQETIEPLQYDMTFKGRGEATTVQTVTVENLSTGATLELEGNKVLRLTNTPSSSGIDEIPGAPKVQSFVYPNPSFGQAQLTFANRAAGNVSIGVYDLQGKMMASSSFHLETGKHTAALPAMPTGTYLVSLHRQGINESVKWISTGGNNGGGISLSGFETLTGANEEAPLPADISEPQPQFRASAANAGVEIVEMKYEDGELLRFTGTNGNRKTIVMNTPTLSHEIIFDLYECQDANGYHYAILNAGGMLWMAEDLRNVPTSLVALRASQSQWSGYPADQPKQAYFEFSAENAEKGGYYNYAGAKLALPAGWDLPTAGEVDYMLNKLGGYVAAAQKLKARGREWAQQANAPDTTSFGALPMGELNPDGTFSGEDFRVKYWTRSTKNAVPVFWGIENSNALLDKDITAEVGYGLRVRACRPAPSAYANMLELFNNEKKSAPALRAGKLFADGPLGGMYNVFVDKKNLWQDFNAAGATAPALKVLDYNSNSYLDASSGHLNRLQKAAAMDNSNGTQNLAVALWSRDAGLNTIEGDGYVSIVIYGDSAQNYTKIDSIQLPAQYNMPVPATRLGMDAYSINLNESSVYSINQPWTFAHMTSLNPHKWYAKRMQLLSADFNADGTGDFVLMVGNRIDVYSGVSPYPLLYTKTFTYNNLRMAVGDVDGDLSPDIAVLYPLNNDNAQVEFYAGGNLSAAASGVAAVPAGVQNDIKIGNVKPNGKNSIVTTTRKVQNETATLRILDHDINVSGKLAVLSAANKSIKVSAYGSDNDNITLCRFRGSNYPADIITAHHCYRFNDNGSNELSVFPYYYHQEAGMGFPSDETLTGDNPRSSAIEAKYTILADNMVAGNFNNDPEGKEKIYFYRSSIESVSGSSAQFTSSDSWQTITVYGNFRETRQYRTAELLWGTHFYINNSSDSKSFDQANSAAYTVNYSVVGKKSSSINNCYLQSVSSTSISNTVYNYGLLASVRSTEPGKSLKYIEHQTSMSEPRIYALLAAPPYYKYKQDGTPYEYSNFSSMGTSWGKSQTNGSGTNNASSNKVAAIFGYEQDFNIPIIGTKIGGIDFTTKLESEWTNSTERQYTESQSIEFTAPQNDAVILSANFFDTYTYEIVSSGNPDEIGTKLSISLPTQQRTMGMDLEDYKRLAADNPECPNLSNLFKHKVGFPFTYPDAKTQIVSNVSNSTPLWAMPFNGEEFISIGSGNDVNRSIELTEETVQTSGFNFNMEMELVVTLGGIKAGAGYGHGNTNESSHSEGKGHAVAGHVAGLTTLGDCPDFKWTLVWYKYRLGGQEFPVVHYVVRP